MISNVSLLPDFTGVDGSTAASEVTAAPMRECKLNDFTTVLLTRCIRGTQGLNLLHIAISTFAQPSDIVDPSINWVGGQALAGS